MASQQSLAVIPSPNSAGVRKVSRDSNGLRKRHTGASRRTLTINNELPARRDANISVTNADDDLDSTGNLILEFTKDIRNEICSGSELETSQ